MPRGRRSSASRTAPGEPVLCMQRAHCYYSAWAEHVKLRRGAGARHGVRLTVTSPSPQAPCPLLPQPPPVTVSPFIMRLPQPLCVAMARLVVILLALALFGSAAAQSAVPPVPPADNCAAQLAAAAPGANTAGIDPDTPLEACTAQVCTGDYAACDVEQPPLSSLQVCVLPACAHACCLPARLPAAWLPRWTAVWGLSMRPGADCQEDILGGANHHPHIHCTVPCAEWQSGAT